MATKKKMLQAAAGNAVGGGGAGGGGGEEIFSIDVWTGNGVNSSDTLQVTNDVDFTQGGMVWIKARDQAYGHSLHDTERGFGNYISTASSGGENYAGNLGWSAGSFNSDGFSSPRGTNQSINELGSKFVSYSFRNAPRFFEAIEYTGDGTGGNRGISHNLGVEPSAIWIKNLDSPQDWDCAFRTSGDTWQYELALNTTDGGGSYNYKSNGFPISSTQFFTYTGTGTEGENNTSGVRYIAYIFAGNSDGGYGPNGNDDVISIGSYSGNGSSQKINIGFQPEFLLVKRLAGDSWPVVDHMRRFSQDESPLMRTNSNGTESAPSAHVRPYTEGFEVYTGDGEWNYSGSNYVYMAIRSKKSTMPPVSADEVFHASYGDASYGLSYPESILTTSMRVDMFINTSGANNYAMDRMRSSTSNLHYLNVGDSAAETDGSDWRLDLGSTGVGYTTSRAEPNRPFQAWKRAPHFFAMSAWTGNGSSQYIPHDLGIKPDLIIVKKRDTNRSWIAYSSPMGATKYIEPDNSNAAGVVSTVWGNIEPSNQWFHVQGNESVNNSGAKYIGYSFGSVAGVSKISSYIGNNSSQTIDCGFSAGVQFILIKRLDSSGEWYFWDKARGIVSGSEAHSGFGVSEFTSDSIDPTSVGFVVEELSGSTSINASGGEYLFYAIAN